MRTGEEHYNRAARFWARIFGINFALGVVTGIPMEFQFGTNWAAFSKAGNYGLKIGLIWRILGMILAAGYFTFVYRSFASKVAVDKDSHLYGD